MFPGTNVSFGYSTGKFEAGRNKTDISNKRLLAGVSELIACWRRYSDSDKQFFYSKAGYVRDGHVISLASHPQPDREELKWTPTWVLMLADPETREQYALALSSNSGKEDALSALQNAFVDHNTDQEAPGFWDMPIVELSSRSYTRSDNKTGYQPIIDVVGWATMPPWFRAPKLPPEALDSKPKPSTTDEFGQEVPF
jgi:hypothetical protein